MNYYPNILFIVLIALSLLSLISSAKIGLKGDKVVCLKFKVMGSETFYFVSTGSDDSNVHVTITTSAGEVVLDKSSNDETYLHSYGEGAINVCFESTTGTERAISFDLYKEDDPLVNVIEKRDLRLIENVLNKVHKKME
jgi:hypothetical protein